MQTVCEKLDLIKCKDLHAQAVRAFLKYSKLSKVKQIYMRKQFKTTLLTQRTSKESFNQFLYLSYSRSGCARTQKGAKKKERERKKNKHQKLGSQHLQSEKFKSKHRVASQLPDFFLHSL